MSLDIVTMPLRAPAPHFQRSINLTYDAGDVDYIAGYIPTPNGAAALAAILSGTSPHVHQRAHVLHAAYGSGKSLFGLVLAAFASRDGRSNNALAIVQDRLERTFPEHANLIKDYLNSDKRLLPVLLSGDNGFFTTAITKALTRSLAQHNIPDLQLPTQFQAALNVIRLWEDGYPDAYRRLLAKLSEKNLSLSEFSHDLSAFKNDALMLFERLYLEIAAGAQFDQNAGLTLDNIFHVTVGALHSFGYQGIIIIWDEFGRFLESRVGDAFGVEAALLQSLAEYCNRSSTYQVHLVLITHRLISGYASGLPLSHQQEWARIAERFRAYDVSSDPGITYRLIAEALGIPNPGLWQIFIERQRSAFNELTALSLEMALFDEVDDVVLRQQVIERSWPLHPLSIYALPRLASRVAQNERTLFTFLATDEQDTLAEQLRIHRDADTWWLVRLDIIWNYFAESIRANTGPGGVHTIWSGAMYALSKVDADDTLAQSLVKALAVLVIVGEVNIQSKAGIGQVVPTTEILAWALGVPQGEVVSRLTMLAQRRAVSYRRSDGYWTFTRGSDVDLDAEINSALERHAPNHQQIRQMLEHEFSPPYYLPRGYNQERRMTRFFKGLYCWPEEIKNIYTEVFLKQLGDYGYADGAIVYVLATNTAEREQAIETVHSLPGGRVIYAISDQPLLLLEPIRELFALRDLSNNVGFMLQDERLPGEIAFFIEDVQRRIETALNPILEPDYLKVTWWWYEGSRWCSGHQKTKDISQLLSRLSSQWFGKTPVLNNEMVNQYEPSGQQERAIEKVIDVLLGFPHDVLPPNLNLPGHGPDWLIARTLLFRTGLLQLTVTGHIQLKKPTADSSLAPIWDIVQNFLASGTENEQEVLPLTDMLQLPPFGLRRGVLPLLFAAMLRFHLPVLTVRQNGRIVSPITGHVFVALCKQPEQYTLELSPWDIRRSALWGVLGEMVESFLTAQERTQQPLATLSVGLLRWLQSQPRYCRDTNSISLDAQQFRNLLRKAQRESTQVLSYDLLELLDKDNVVSDDENSYKQLFHVQLTNLMDEVATAYQALLYSLDRFARETFADHASDGHTALHLWVTSLEERTGTSLNTFRFGDKLAQILIQIAYQDGPTQGRQFWDQLSKAVLGIGLNDWNDRSLENFKSSLVEVKERVEHEVLELTDDEAAVKLSVSLPAKSEQTYRFRLSNLSPQGQRILQNFKSTLEIAGRPLSLDEKRQIVLALLDFTMEGSDPHD